jgi:hypothetical protein
MDDACKDFGVAPRPGFEEEARKWAAETFDQVVAENKDGIVTLTEEEAVMRGYTVMDGIIYKKL